MGIFQDSLGPVWARDLRFRVLDVLDNTNALLRLTKRLVAGMNTDRDLLATLAVAVGSIGAAVDTLATDRDQWRDRALAAEGREASDEAGDVDAAQPLKDAIAAVVAKLSPVAPPAADPDDPSEPLPPIEDVAPVVEAAPDPVADESAPAADAGTEPASGQ